MERVRELLGVLHQLIGIPDVCQAKPENSPHSVNKAAITVFEVPRVDLISGSGPPEQFAQVLSDTLPQDLAGALTLLTAAHNKLIEVGSATVHWLHGNYGCCTVPFREVDRMQPSFQGVNVVLSKTFIK